MNEANWGGIIVYQQLAVMAVIDGLFSASERDDALQMAADFLRRILGSKMAF